MSRKLLWILLLSATLAACNGSDDDKDEGEDEDLPQQSFANRSDYGLGDFSLNDSYQYWEIRLDQSSLEGEEAEVLYRYDVAAHETLNEQQLTQLAEAESETGFTHGCPPEDCAVYGVAVTDTELRLITSANELLAFFDGIDTEAELNLWLMIEEYEPEVYEEVDGGYQVVATKWDCDHTTQDLLFIDSNGTVTKERELSTTPTGVCP